MESDDDYYTVSECLSSKVSSYGSCTPIASDQEEEYDTDTIVREVLQTRKLMLSPVRGCVETSEYIYKDTPILRTEKQAKCRDVLELKVLELCPELTLLGETLEEASSLQAEHERVLEKIQEKQSPVNELLKKADHLIATQNTQPEVYAAMADSLGLAWKDVNDILQKRSYLLHLNVEYHRQAEVCMERIRTLEMLCHSYLPTDVESIKNHLEHIQEVRKSILEALMVALGNGTQLLDVLKEMQAKGTLDSRPGYNYHSISLAVSQVEHWLEKLHDKRHSLDIDCHERKTMLEKRLTISLLVTDLNLLENILSERKNSLEKVKNCLGDSQYECSKFTEVNSNLITEAKDIRDQALRVAKATEQLVLTKGYMEEDYKCKAYKLLELATEYLEELNRRENLLDAAMKFFETADKVLRAWETILQHSSDEQLASKNTYVTETVKRTGASVIQEGNLILKDLPEAEGVKRVVDELERKKQLILSIVMKDREKYMESSEAVNTFSENYNNIFSWLVSLAESFLHEHNSMGTNLTEAREFLISHKTLQRDLRSRGIDINALVNSTSLPPLTYIDAETRVDLESKSVVLKDHWAYLDRILDWRIQLSELYVKFFTSCEHLNIEFSNLDSVIADHVDVSDQRLDSAHKYWTNILQLYIQLKNTGEKFLHQSAKSEDAHLELDVARDRVRSLLDTFVDRKTRTTSVWETWQRASAENKLDKVLWSETMCESSKTVDWVSKLESQLYPVLKSEPSSIDRHISEVKQKLNNVLPEVQRAQDDIESRIKTAEELIGKGNIQGDNISIPPRLKELHSRLVGITTEYQNLLDMFLSFFNSLQEFHNTVKESERGRPADIFNHKLNEVEELLKKHNQSRQAVLDSFKTVYAENIRLMDKIKQQEPQKSGEQDMYVVRYLMENERNLWDQSCEIYCQKIEQQQQLSQFDNDLIQINNNLNDLSQQLSSTRGQYGANLASAKSASLAFHYFEKTILLLEQRIETFINAANSLMNFEHNKSEHIRDELNKLKSRWDTFQAQVLESRKHIDLCVQYFTLINEAQDWFHEGSILLMNIARKSTEVKTSEEASALLKEIEIFLKPGDIRQDERLNQIHELSIQLFGEHAIAEVPQVVTENKELLDSFSMIAKELKSFDDKLKSKEKYEINSEVNQIITNTYEEIMTSTSITNGVSLNEDNIPSSKKIKLEEIIKPKPSIVVPLQDNTVDEGKKFTFECSIEGEPSKVTWFKDNISIDNNPDYQTSKIGNRYILTIEETFVEDSAKFTCRAENDSDVIETSAYLSVKECAPEHQISPSVFTKLLSDLLVKEGDACSFSCKAEGNPLPTVQWYKDDICIDNSPQYQITYNNGEALLKIEHTNSSTHGGKYTCVATNRLGSDSTTSMLLIDALEKSEDGPTFIVPLSNVMARAGQKLKLECEVETNKPPVLIWFHNGKVMKEIKDFKVSENRGKINLIIPEAYPKDAGTYSLTIKTEHGEATSSCQVSVKGILPNETSDSEIASDLEPIKPSIPLRLKEQTVLEGGSVHLKCVIIGQPEPEVIWYHDGRPVKESKDIQLLFQGDQCSLIIKEAFVEDAGEYKVVAINSAGEANSTCVLSVEPKSVADIDEHVVSPKFTKLLSDVLVREGDSITLECNADGCPKPDFKWIRNTVEIKPDQRITLSTDEDGTATLHIHNALPVDKGQYTVIAVNKAGEAKCFSHVIVKAISTFESAVKPSTDKVHFEEKLETPLFTETFSPNVNVVPGESVKFECIVVGKPAPKVRWLFNEKPVSGKSFLVSTSGDRQVLTIPEVNTEHDGIVECVAENEAGKCRCVSSLKIKESEAVPLTMAYNGGGDLKHTVSEVYESSSKFESKQSTFMSSSSSSISGDNASKFKLDSFSLQSEKQSRQFGDNAPVQSESLRTEEYHNTDGQESQHVSDLSSTNISEEHQTSFFERGLYNQGGLVKDTSQKSLLERNISKHTRRETAPRFVSAPQGKIAEQGRDVFLDAIIDSYPQSDITWSKNGIELISDGVKLIITNEVNKTRLDIKRLTVEDSGQYTCKAMNAAGGTSCTTDVIVKKNVFPPVMCRRLLPNTVAEGERVVLEIEVAGTPEPTVSWFKNNQPLSATSNLHRLRQQGNCSAVVIEKATTEHAGEYKVVAKNEGGEAVSCADLRVVQPLPDIGLNLLPTYASNDNTDKVNVDYYKSIVPMNQSKQLNIISKTQENSHFSKSVFVQESINNTKDVVMTVNRSETNDFDLNSNNTNANYETTEKQISVQNENIENGSITKKSALQFFKNVIEDNKVEKSSNSTVASSTGTYKRESPVDKFNNNSNNFASVKSYNNEENVSNSSFKQSNDAEVILEPGPPPTFDYMPRAQSVKKDQMTERLRRLSTNQKLLSPEQIPSGAVRIFPDVNSEIKQEVFEETCVKKEVIKSGLSDNTTTHTHLATSQAPLPHSEPHVPLLRPQADINVRPGSPRPSAEAISMEKLWTKAHSSHVQKTPVSFSPVHMKTYSSSESQSFVSETIEKNGELIKNESKEEKQGSLKIDDGVKKVSESFSEISIGPTKHVEPPRNEIKRPASAHLFNEAISKDSFFGNKIQTQHFSEESSQIKTSSMYDVKSNISENIERNSFNAQSERQLKSNQSFDRNMQNTYQFLPERSIGPIKHVEPPSNDKVSSNFTRSHSVETAREKQWVSQSPVAFRGPPQNKTYSSFEAHSSFSKSLEKDGVLVASEFNEEGGRVVDDGVQKVYDSFSERSKLPSKIADLSKNTNKSNSIKTMQKMFEQTGSSSAVSNVASNIRPYSRIKSRASDSDFESEAELSKYNVEQKVSESYNSFESKMYSSKTQLQEIKSTSMIMQSPIRESGYAADTDEPRGFQSEAAANNQTFNSKRNSGFQSASIKKAEFSENERRQPHRAHPMQWANQYNQHCRAQVRSPAKFVRGEFRESDYESDYECRIQPIWRPNDSESEEPVYKPVRPGFKTPVKNVEGSRHLQPVKSVAAPVEAFELKPGSPPEMGFAPSPDVHRSVSFVESERNESVQRTTHFLSSDGRGHGHGTLERNAEAKRLQRVDEMRKRFEQKSLCPAESGSVQQAVSSQLTQDGTVISPIYQKELNVTEHSDPSHSSPFFATPLKDIAVVSGKPARFECIVQGEPVGEIVWSCNGQVLENSDCYQTQYRNGVCRLTIPRTYQFNAGSYSCTVSNYLGSSSTSADLRVSGESRTFIQH
ncbi:muscle M-line assembly protein unc-89 isoform X4 [Rhopalosiphum maidis]|uniref:muscle M-line assembly protein unc-89 isoform X4 n=1 Tax=Rhopalosiphum maidis TaxID=43146 RepID=UPI000F004171|nr:muscle M-line assembly protein unc-89 isoform X4 [Rhopalosiphum maidis]